MTKLIQLVLVVFDKGYMMCSITNYLQTIASNPTYRQYCQHAANNKRTNFQSFDFYIRLSCVTGSVEISPILHG